VTLHAGLGVGLFLAITTAFQVRLILDSRILELRSRWSYRKNAFSLFAFLFFLSMQGLLVSPVTRLVQQPLLGILFWIASLAAIVAITVSLAAVFSPKIRRSAPHS
jgi:hypothetical protein